MSDTPQPPLMGSTPPSGDDPWAAPEAPPLPGWWPQRPNRPQRTLTPGKIFLIAMAFVLGGTFLGVLGSGIISDAINGVYDVGDCVQVTSRTLDYDLNPVSCSSSSGSTTYRVSQVLPLDGNCSYYTDWPFRDHVTENTYCLDQVGSSSDSYSE